MRFSLTGDLDALTRFGARVAALGKPSTMTALSKALADEALNLLQQGFVKQQDPYGKPWFPKRFNDGRRILRGKTGQLEKSFYRAYAGADGAIITSRARHAFVTLGTGVYGPRKQPIKAKPGKALRFRGPGGGWMFRKQVDGSPQRLVMPLPGKPSPIWNRALKARAKAFLLQRLGKVGRAA
jgi:hypothetical protein